METLNNGWLKESNLYYREFDVVLTQSLNEIVSKLIDLLSTNRLIYSNVVETFKRPRNKGEEQSDYVADIIGIGSPNATHSHYTKDENPIIMTLPSGKKVNSIVRIANHKGDIGNFADKHPNIDYCISIVVGEKERKFPDTPVPEGRVVHIIEYVLDKNFENKERILMNIADKVADIMKNGWNINSNTGIRTNPVDNTNGTTIIKESELRQIIREEIEKYINCHF